MMEAVMIRSIDAEQVRSALKRVRDTRGNDGKGLAGVETATGVNRTTLSQFVNNGFTPDSRKLETLAGYLEAEYGYDFDISDEETASVPERPVPRETIIKPESPVASESPVRLFGASGEIYPTQSYKLAFSAINFHRRDADCRACVMIGAPGIGKTTVLREYAHQTENTYYIDCWPYMGAQDIMEAIAEAIDFGLRPGSVMNRTKQIMRALDERPGALLIYDEAENLIGSNARKLDTLRKITDPENGRRVHRTSLFAGTRALETAIKRGGLSQIVRRAREVPISGVKAEDIREMLRDYDVTEDARKGLTELALDTARGGMGNFVETLNICLNYTQGRTITGEVFRSAKRYKFGV